MLGEDVLELAGTSGGLKAEQETDGFSGLATAWVDVVSWSGTTSGGSGGCEGCSGRANAALGTMPGLAASCESFLASGDSGSAVELVEGPSGRGETDAVTWLAKAWTSAVLDGACWTTRADPEASSTSIQRSKQGLSSGANGDDTSDIPWYDWPTL